MTVHRTIAAAKPAAAEPAAARYHVAFPKRYRLGFPKDRTNPPRRRAGRKFVADQRGEVELDSCFTIIGKTDDGENIINNDDGTFHIVRRDGTHDPISPVCALQLDDRCRLVDALFVSAGEILAGANDGRFPTSSELASLARAVAKRAETQAEMEAPSAQLAPGEEVWTKPAWKASTRSTIDKQIKELQQLKDLAKKHGYTLRGYMD
jgi:hypothetical protein